MKDPIDLDFRPKSYFGPQGFEDCAISQVKGAVVRDALEELRAEGRYDKFRSLLEIVQRSGEDIKSLGAVHPMFMGGNYLPDTEGGEVEVARIAIESSTFDVTSVFARMNRGLIELRVVDEYGGDTLTEHSKMTLDKPLTLGEFTDFFLAAWPLIDVLDMNFGGELEPALGFFHATSAFYPDFDRLCRQRVIEAFPPPEDDDYDILRVKL